MAKNGAKLTLTQAQYTPFVYDLTREYPGQVPDAPMVYHPTKSELAQDRRPLLRGQAGARSGLPVRRHPESLARLRRARAPPGHPGRVGHARPEVGRVARPEHRRRPAVADGLRGEVLPPRQADAAGLVRPGDPTRATATPSGSTTPAGQDYMTWNVQAWSSSSTQLGMGGFLQEQFGETPLHLKVYQGKHLIDDEQVQPRHAVRAGAAGQQALPGGRSTRAGRLTCSGSRPGRTREWRFMSDTVPGDEIEDVRRC